MGDCRIPYADDKDLDKAWNDGNAKINPLRCENTKEPTFKPMRIVDKEGRFPANLIISDDVLDTGKEHKSGHMDCVAKNEGGVCYGKYNPHSAYNPGDSGGFSRFFSLDAWAEKNLPFLIVPKASKKEKNAGCENIEPGSIGKKGNGVGRICEHCGAPQLKPCDCEPKSWIHPKIKNFHPTVKPIKLFCYLITMGSRPGDVVLDPFMGSGTTGVAAKMLGRNFIGIELDPEYVKIAEARIDFVKEDILNDLFKGE